MATRPAGARYPFPTTDVRDADHRFCPVLDAIRRQVAEGARQWGDRIDMPDRLTEAKAKDAKQGLYRARNHTTPSRVSCGAEPLSVQADYESNGDGTYSVWVRVWPRSVARAEIVRRVKGGESLAYNSMRKRVD